MGIKERQDREKQAVRESIRTAARDLFVMEGYAHVSIRKFAERIEYPRLVVGLRPARRPRYRPSGTRDGLDRSRRRSNLPARASRLRRCPTRTGSSPRPNSPMRKWRCCRPSSCCSRRRTRASLPPPGRASRPACRKNRGSDPGLGARGGPVSTRRAGRSGARSAARTPARCRRGSCRPGARAPRWPPRCPSARTPAADALRPSPS